MAVQDVLSDGEGEDWEDDCSDNDLNQGAVPYKPSRRDDERARVAELFHDSSSGDEAWEEQEEEAAPFYDAEGDDEELGEGVRDFSDGEDDAIPTTMTKLNVAKLPKAAWKADGYVAFDIETTGGPKLSNAIIQLAALFINKDSQIVGEPFDRLISTTRCISREVIKVHGITHEKLKAADGDFSMIGRAFISWLADVAEGCETVCLVAPFLYRHCAGALSASSKRLAACGRRLQRAPPTEKPGPLAALHRPSYLLTLCFD